MDAQQTRLVKAILTDSNLQNELTACKTMADAYNAAKKLGHTLPENDFKQTMMGVNEQIRQLRGLNDEELRNAIKNPGANRMGDNEIAAMVNAMIEQGLFQNEIDVNNMHPWQMINGSDSAAAAAL